MNEAFAVLILILFTLARFGLPLAIIVGFTYLVNLASDRRTARLSGM